MTRFLRNFVTLALGGLLVALPALSQNAPTGPPAAARPPAGMATDTNKPPPLPTSLTGYVPDDKYKLRKGDQISFQVLEDGDAPRGLMVNDSGELNFPYVGRVAVVDKTCKQVAAELKVLLEKEYYYEATPILALELANRVLGRIYLWGQVRSQGPMDMAVNEDLTVGKAILRAGGFAEFANKKKVKLMRGTGDTSVGRQTIELNMEEILDQGHSEKDMPVQPEDFIVVPARWINM